LSARETDHERLCFAFRIARLRRGAAKTIEAPKAEGFGVLTHIDIAATLKQKLGVEFRKHRILGACNSPLALKALSAEDKIGAMLPCNVAVQERAKGGVELAAIDPRAAMQRVGNLALAAVAEDVAERLARALQAV
jgi:uncharacterized protein (DUF302 family)